MAEQKRRRSASVRRLDEDAWLEGIRFLLSLDLSGLSVHCPNCERMGTPTSKWKRGPKAKPLHVFHPNGGSEPDICTLDEEEARQIQREVTLHREDVETLLVSARPFVLFSGGRDSLCALHYLATLASSLGQTVTALHVDTTAGFPEVTGYVESICRRLEVRLEIVTPGVDYFTLAKEWGIPGVSSRWCCRELKIRPMAEFLARVPDRKIVFDGIRAMESAVRGRYLPVWFHPSFNCLSVSPIFEWTDQDVDSYAGHTGLPPNPCAELGTSGECWCGAYKSRADFEALYHLHPDLYDRLMDVEKANKHGFTFVYENGQRIPLKKLQREIEARDRDSVR
jgi:3'-phosphoadenosine 5'-phosphosulfate sulfotransferase (PAPS reductase)/FAD synthetase